MTDKLLILAKVLQVYDSIYYTACTVCYSKLHTNQDSQKEVCLKCGEVRKSTEGVKRYRVSLLITDGHSHADVTVFGTQLEQFIGASAQYLHTYTQWMTEIGIDNNIVNVALEQVFCDRWFLFGFKFERKANQKQPNLRDVVKNSCSIVRTQNCTNQSLTAWQMTPASSLHVTRVSVISLVKYLVHQIIDRRRNGESSKRVIGTQSRHSSLVATSVTENSSSFDDSCMLCDLSRSCLCSPVSNRSKSFNNEGIDISYVSMYSAPNDSYLKGHGCSTCTQATNKLIVSPPLPSGNTMSATRGLLADVTASDIVSQDVKCDTPTSGIQGSLITDRSRLQLSLEVQRACTQEAVNSVLFELDSVDFSDSFSSNSAITMGENAMNLDHTESDISASVVQNLQITHGLKHLNETANLDRKCPDYDDTEYYNLQAGCDDTVDVMYEFKRACNPTQMPTCTFNKHECRQSASTAALQSGEKASRKALSVQDNCRKREHCDSENSFNDSSLLLCVDVGDSAGKMLEPSSSGTFTFNDSSFLLCQNKTALQYLQSNKGNNATNSYQNVLTSKQSMVPETKCDDGPNVSSTASVNFDTIECPYSEDVEAFINDIAISNGSTLSNSTVQDIDNHLIVTTFTDVNSSLPPVDLVDFTNSRQNTVDSTVHCSELTKADVVNKYAGENVMSCPYSEDLAAFLNDTDCQDDLVPTKSQREIGRTDTVVDEIVQLQTLLNNTNYLDNFARAHEKCFSVEDMDNYLPESENLSMFLHDMDEDSMNIADGTSYSGPVLRAAVHMQSGHMKQYPDAQLGHKTEVSDPSLKLNESLNILEPDKHGLYQQQSKMNHELLVQESKEMLVQTQSFISTQTLHVEHQNIVTPSSMSDNNLVPFQFEQTEANRKLKCVGTNGLKIKATNVVTTSTTVCQNTNTRALQSDYITTDVTDSRGSDFSADLFSVTSDDSELIFTNSVDQSHSYHHKAPAHLRNICQSHKKHTYSCKRKSVCFAKKLLQRELISHIDYQMQTTPVSIPKPVRNGSCLKRSNIAVAPLHDLTNSPILPVASLPYSEELFTPSPLMERNSGIRKNCFRQSTPRVSDLASPSLFSSPDTPQITHHIRTVPTGNVRSQVFVDYLEHVDTKHVNKLITSHSESSLFSNESLFSSTGSPVVKGNRNAKDQYELNTPRRVINTHSFYDDSDCIPPSCTRTGHISKKFKNIIL